ncbi:MAG: hypothetical protein GTO30_10095, partial [Acidobacteria bacterium]|nr:hypothetical protein [Acidobacteriota bacterium]NIQ85829.1 hypothetical protein [Acidobacteriota bacterium]
MPPDAPPHGAYDPQPHRNRRGGHGRMIGRLSGTLVESSPGGIVIDVGGVG